MKAARWVGSAVIGAALLCGARTALASNDYLGIVQQKGWKGDCRLCHTVQPGTFMTATQPFAETLKLKGLMGGTRIDLLNAALAKLSSEDSDGDEKSDLEELMNSWDPNVRGPGTVGDIEPVQYGCFNSVVGRHEVPANGAGVFAGLLTATALWRTRRRGALSR